MPNPSILVLKHAIDDVELDDNGKISGYRIIQQVDSPGDEFPVHEDLMWISDESLNLDSDYVDADNNFIYDFRLPPEENNSRNRLKKKKPHAVEMPPGLSDSDISNLL